MEDVLEVYKRPYDPLRPVVALDEKPVQILSDTRKPIPCEPGSSAKQDHEYKRNGTANIFCAVEPLGNFRRLELTERRTKLDFAHFVKDLVDTRYKDARKIVLVMDNLNTHSPASFYDAFEPKEARRLTEKLEIHHTPKHGSWLNVAEIELSVIGRRLRDRCDNVEDLARQLTAIERDRNQSAKGIDWQFNTDNARIKLKRLYPSFELR
jgi:DDE superfamily endonuclease